MAMIVQPGGLGPQMSEDEIDSGEHRTVQKCQSAGLHKATRAGHGPINGPVTEAMIGPKGGQLELLGNVLVIPEGALTRPMKIELGVVWNQALMPPVRGDHKVSAVFSCQPEGVRFLKPVMLQCPHNLNIAGVDIKDLKPVLYTCHHIIDGKAKWERYSYRPTDKSFIFRQSIIEVEVHTFCYFTWCLEDGSPIDAKRIVSVPYASPFQADNHRVIRAYFLDDTEEEKQRILKEEKELGGERLTGYFPYVLLKNFGDVELNVVGDMPGWQIHTEDQFKLLQFKEMWSCSHNMCELHFTATARATSRFTCRLMMKQIGNASTAKISFDAGVQTISTQEYVTSSLSSLHQTSTPIRNSGPKGHRLRLPSVPPLPEFDRTLLSADDLKPRESLARVTRNPSSGPMLAEVSQVLAGVRQFQGCSLLPEGAAAQPVVPQGEFAVNLLKPPHSLATKVPCQEARPGNAKAINNFFINAENLQVNVNAKSNEELDAIENPAILPLKLKRELASCLDTATTGIGDWLDLARHWSLEVGYANACEKEKSPGFEMLCLGEYQRKFKNLEDLCEAFENIKRDDCVEKIQNYIKEYRSPPTAERCADEFDEEDAPRSLLDSSEGCDLSLPQDLTSMPHTSQAQAGAVGDQKARQRHKSLDRERPSCIEDLNLSDY